MKITENLLIRFLKCETTSEEEVAILDWLDADPENIKTLDRIDFQFNATVLHSEIQKDNAPKSRVKKLISFSAAAILATEFYRPERCALRWRA